MRDAHFRGASRELLRQEELRISQKHCAVSTLGSLDSACVSELHSRLAGRKRLFLLLPMQ
jgi:hypothetical protein